MTLRLDDAETEALRETAEREHRSMQEVAREAVRLYTSGHVARRRAMLAEIVERDREMLDRLASGPQA